MYDGEDTTITPPVTDAPATEETVMAPQEAEAAPEAAPAPETPAQA